MRPAVSIIVPCYNEEATIGPLLEALFHQVYPRQQMEVIVADGLSQDRTREVIAAFQLTHPDFPVSIKDNPSRTIPAGLNIAAAAACGDILVRLDAHCIPVSGYVECCVDALEAGRGSVVGGVWHIQPGGKGFIAQAIALAAAHPLGVGDAMYRRGASEGPVDTVPFGAVRRSLFQQMGGFDESLLTNEDYEFYTRVREAGGVIWLDPAIRSTYIARATLAALARQYWRYGFWKLKMLQAHPRSLRWRQAVPPLFVLSLIVLGVLSIVLPLAGWVLLAEIALYLLALAAAGLHAAVTQSQPLLLPGLVLAIATMHFSWGSGFLWSLLSAPKRHG